jgi:phosphoribosylglycinamide formyltransferase 1
MINSIFIGTRLEALEALNRFTNIELIVTKKGSWVYNKYNNSKINIQLIDKTNKLEIFDLLSKIETRLMLSAGFPYILPHYVFNSDAFFVNSHPGLLPSYKGYNAIKNALKHDEDHLGITVHYMSEDVDAGEIILQEKVSVKNLPIQDIYGLLFSVVEPFVITKALEIIVNKHFR